MSDLTTSLRDRIGGFCVALTQWTERDTAQDTAAARRVSSAAVDAVDALLRDLYLLRGRLVQEARQAAGTAGRRVA
jgi:hypothetical protein